MMSTVESLLLGLAVAGTWSNLGYCLIGVTVGTLVGVLPGIGPIATIGLLMPITFGLPPLSGMIMLAGIYYGASYGGSTSAILINLPGESASIVTCIDGYRMACKGRAGPALAVAALGSFFAGTVCVLLTAFLGPTIADIALNFGSTEYFSLMLFGLVCASVLGGSSVLKSLAMVVLGLLLGLVGTDVNTGVPRFTFDLPDMTDGLGFIVLTMGIFGVAEMARSLDEDASGQSPTSVLPNVSIWPSRDDLRVSAGPVLRGTAVGALLGPVPGAGATIAAFAAYALEKRWSKDASRFGQGAIEGVAAPEAANNAATQTSFIPMLTLGLPPTASLALMYSAMIIHGIVPGPQVMATRPELFWGLIMSMWIGNAMLLCLNLPMISVWVQLLRVPRRILFPIIMALMSLGAYSINTTAFDLYVLGLFGLLGYLWLKLGCDAAPLILAVVAGPLMEEHLRRAMLIARGDATIFVTRPISALLLLLTATLLLTMVISAYKRLRTRQRDA